jgi:2,3-diketo-5-methylthiopentyl-1-phosphate enolase
VLSPELRYSFDGLDLNTVVVATYFVEIEGGSDVISRVRKISSLIYPGAWTEHVGDAADAWEKHAPRILGIYETPPYELELPRDLDRRRFVIQLAMPLIDLDQNLASLLTSIGGEILAYGNIKLLDVYLPESYVAGFAGPRFGVAGIRRLLGVNERPLLMAIVKPGKGYSPEVGASAFFEAA